MSIVLTGNPGVGKHTLAKHLAKDLHLKIIDLNRIAIEKKIFEKKKNTLDVDVKKLGKIIQHQLTKESLVVGHLAPYVISRKYAKIVIVLRKSPYKLIHVYKERRYSKQKSLENLGSEILGLIYYDSLKAFGRKNTYQFDTTTEPLNKTLKEIQMLLRKGKIPKKNVDWLYLVTNRNDLKRFFPY